MGTTTRPATADLEADGRPASRAGVFGNQPALIGHRGLGRGVVAGQSENTLGSFMSAVELGLRWVEADVRRTEDDVLVVAHDAAYPDGIRLADVTAEETDRRRILRLRRLLEQLPPDAGLNVDLKSSMADSLRAPSRTTAGLLGPVMAAEVRRRPVIVSSFDPAALRRLRDQAPHVPLAWLTWHRFPLDAAVAGCAHMDVEVLGVHIGSFGRDPRTGSVDADEVERTLRFVHGCRRQLLVWCPEVDAARLLVAMGADAVVIDEVPSVLGALRQAQR